MLKSSTLDILMNPYNNQSLKIEALDGSNFLVDQFGNRIPICNGIPNFLVLETTTGLNKKYQKMYDKVSKIAGGYEAILNFLFLEKIRKKVLHELEIKEGDKVLETSVGRGWNIKVLPAYAQYFGLDISRGMLLKCRKHIIKWQRDTEILQGNAEYLPFKDEVFDCVFHVGAINFFNDRKRAIAEMIRVAKPKTKIVILDETAKLKYPKIPFIDDFSEKEAIDPARLIAPIDLVPSEMLDTQVKLILNDLIYQLSFRKP